MSDLSLQLQQASGQLPVTSYFDEALYQREMALLFQQGPRYVGHALAVPEVGDYMALPQEHEGRALVRNAQGIELISNICRHRQAVMLKGRGNLQSPAANMGGNIVCPLHRWTYATNGQLLGAPHFQQDPCLNLNNYKLREWNGLLFEDNGRDIEADLAHMGPRSQLDFTGYALDNLHRGVPRGLPRWSVPPRLGQLCHLRRFAMGVQKRILGANCWRGQPSGQSGQSHL